MNKFISLFFQSMRKFNSQKEQFETMNHAFKKYKQDKLFNAIPKTHFEQVQQENIKYLNNYFDKLAFQEKINVEELLQFLSRSYYLEKNIETQEKINKIIENQQVKLNQIKNIKVGLIFLHFCNSQKVQNEETWQYFNSYIMNNLAHLDFQDQIQILNNYDENNKNNQKGKQLKIELNIFFELFENQFLQSNESDFMKLNMLLEVYRKNQKGSEAFFYTIEQTILENYDDVQIPQLLTILLHYSNSEYESNKTKIKMLENFETKFNKIIKFLTPKELITVLFCYIKSGKGTSVLFKLLSERTEKLMEEFSFQELENLLTIYSNRPQKEKEMIFHSAEQHILKNIQMMKRNIIPQLFFQFCENDQGSDEFYLKMEDLIISMIFHLNNQVVCFIQQLVNCIWGFAVQKQKNTQLFFKKTIEYMKSNNLIYQLSIKQICTIVWGFSKSNNQDKEIFEKFESIIENQIKNYKIKDVSQILWAFTLNYPLKYDVVDQIKEIIRFQVDDCDTWDLTMILWSFSKFQEVDKDLYEFLVSKCVDLLPELEINDVCIMIRSYSEVQVGSLEFYQKLIEKVKFNIDYFDYSQTLSLMFAFSNITIIDQSNFMEIIVLLNKRLQKLKTLQVQDTNSFSDLDTYLTNLEAEKYK